MPVGNKFHLSELPAAKSSQKYKPDVGQAQILETGALLLTELLLTELALDALETLDELTTAVDELVVVVLDVVLLVVDELALDVVVKPKQALILLRPA